MPKREVIAELTREEWFQVRLDRGRAMTGQRYHHTIWRPINQKDPTICKGMGRVYYWSMGSQPTPKIKERIARRCPLKAAKAYLKYYHQGTPGTSSWDYSQPVPKAPCKEKA